MWSADYPGVIAEFVRRELGTEVMTVFTPGACGNINPTMGGSRWREGAEYFAQQTSAALDRAIPVGAAIAVDGRRRDVAVPRRDSASQAEGAIERLRWGSKVVAAMCSHPG